MGTPQGALEDQILQPALAQRVQNAIFAAATQNPLRVLLENVHFSKIL